MPADGETLAWIAYAGAFLGVVSYFWVWFRRPNAIRLFSNAGLFLTSFALACLPPILRGDPDSERFGFYALASLLLAVLAQLAAGLRERRRRGQQWDGVDRRGDA